MTSSNYRGAAWIRHPDGALFFGKIVDSKLKGLEPFIKARLANGCVVWIHAKHVTPIGGL